MIFLERKTLAHRSSKTVVLSLSGVGIRLVSRSTLVVSLLSTKLPVMTDVKGKDVVDEDASWCGGEQRSTARNAFQNLQHGIRLCA